MLACFVVLASNAVRAQQVTSYVSSKAGDRLAKRPPLQFAASTSQDVDFRIHDATRNQTILGFGASFLEAGMICLNSLSHAQQDDVLRALFDPERGAGFSAMKSPIAATDFMSAGGWYSYDDTPGDTAMQHFSIARDLRPNGLITYIKRAQPFGKFVIESPMDYPPDWMLIPDKDKAKQHVNAKYFPALALYYLRYLQEYKKHGVFIDYLSLFNEPGGYMGHSEYAGYTTIGYEEIAHLITGFVGPLLAKEKIASKLLLSEASTREVAYEGYPTVLDNPTSASYVSAIAYHGYDFANFDKVAALRERYPHLPLWMTEICHFSGYSPHMPMPRYDFEDGQFWGNQIFSDLEAGASGWTYWNMILDEHGGPWLVSPIHKDPEKNAQHPVVIVNRATKTVTYTGLYFYLAHFSKFVRPGSVRIETTGARNGIRCMAFTRPDGSLAAVLMNANPNIENVTVEWRGRFLALNLPASSIATITWKAATAVPVR